MSNLISIILIAICFLFLFLIESFFSSIPPLNVLLIKNLASWMFFSGLPFIGLVSSSWLGLRVLRISSSWFWYFLGHFFTLVCFQCWDGLRLIFMIFVFTFLYVELSRYHVLDYNLGKLTRVAISLFFCWFFFKIIYFLVLSFNIGLFENWTL